MRLKNPWYAGYVLPQNVKDEVPGQGVIITKQAKRGTIDSYVPNYWGSLGSDEGQGSLGGHVFSGKKKRRPLGNAGGTRAGLGAVTVTATVGAASGTQSSGTGTIGDPTKQYTVVRQANHVNALSAAQKSLWAPVREYLKSTSWDNIKYTKWWPHQGKKVIIVRRFANDTRFTAPNGVVWGNEGWADYWAPDDWNNSTGSGTWYIAPAPRLIGKNAYDISPITSYTVGYKSLLDVAKDIGKGALNVLDKIAGLACKVITDPRTGKVLDLAKKEELDVAIASKARIGRIAEGVCNLLYPGDPGYDTAVPLDEGGSSFLSMPVLLGAGVLAFLLLRKKG